MKILQIITCLSVFFLSQLGCESNNLSSNPSSSSSSTSTEKLNTPTNVINDSKIGKLVLHNPEIISDVKHSSLTTEQKVLVSLLDDYEFFYNKHENPNNKYNFVEGQVPFGEGYITIKVSNVPDLNNSTSCDIRADVEVKKNVNDSNDDSNTTLKGNFAFRFAKDTNGVWGLYYWWP